MTHLEFKQGEFVISTDPSRLDLEAMCAFLEQTYWSRTRTREVMKKAIRNSFSFGVYRGSEQVGFGRAVTDFATYAYLADVYILEPYRKQGLGGWLIRTMLAHPELKDVRRWGLITQDAQGLYRSCGFRDLKNPEQHMELRHPDGPVVVSNPIDKVKSST